MRVDLNGGPHDVPDGTVLGTLIAQAAGTTRGSAAVVDGEVVPRAAWSSFAVRAGQRIELITAVQGG